MDLACKQFDKIISTSAGISALENMLEVTSSPLLYSVSSIEQSIDLIKTHNIPNMTGKKLDEQSPVNIPIIP